MKNSPGRCQEIIMEKVKERLRLRIEVDVSMAN